MRKLTEVIDQILRVVPLEENKFCQALQSRRDSTIYTSPELMHFRWFEVAKLIEEKFCKVVDGQRQPPEFIVGSWQYQVYNIWMGVTKTLIWWIDQQQHKSITEEQVASLPKYLQELYHDCEGRSGRGRLWVNKEVIPGNPCVDPWPSTELSRKLSKYSGGLVIRIEDFNIVKHMPGVVTDMQLNELSS